MPRFPGTESRASARAAVELDVRLERRVGRAVSARTVDLSAGGARVVSERPLRVDEELQFDVDLPTGRTRLGGTARVLRQDRHNLYALRFETFGAGSPDDLRAFVDATAGAPLH